MECRGNLVLDLQEFLPGPMNFMTPSMTLESFPLQPKTAARSRASPPFTFPVRTSASGGAGEAGDQKRCAEHRLMRSSGLSHVISCDFMIPTHPHLSQKKISDITRDKSSFAGLPFLFHKTAQVCRPQNSPPFSLAPGRQRAEASESRSRVEASTGRGSMPCPLILPATSFSGVSYRAS